MAERTHDLRALRALLTAFLTLDLRGQFFAMATGAKATELIPPLYWVVGQVLTASLLLSAALFGRVEALFFASAGLLATAVVVFSAVVVELHEAVLHPSDRLVLMHRPVPARVIAAARLANLGLYVLLMTVSSAIFPTILGAALRDAGAWWLPAYAAASLATGLGAGAAGLIAAGAGATHPSLDSVRTWLAWLQIAAILVFFYGGQLMLRDPTGAVEWFAAHPPPWFEALPTTWLARQVVSGALAPRGALAVVTALTALVGLAGAQWMTLWRRGVGSVRADPVRTLLTPPRWARWAGSRQGGVGLFLVLSGLLRDPELRARTLPSLALPGAALVLAVFTGQWGDPVRLGLCAETTLPVTAVGLAAGAGLSMLHAVGHTGVPHGGDLLAAAPLQPQALRKGARRAVLDLLLLPATLAATALAAAVWSDAPSALAQAALAWGLIELALAWGAGRALPGPPLSAPVAMGGQLGPAAVLAAVAAAAISTLAAGWAAVAPLVGPGGALLLAAVLIPVARRLG